MNDRRYRSYVHISRTLRSDLFNAFEQVLLDVDQLEANIDAVLQGLIAGGRIHPTIAADLRKGIWRCGPRTTAAVAA